MSDPLCPECQCEHTYRDGHFQVCPECAHEWNPEDPAAASQATTAGAGAAVKDAHGNVLQSGDSVIVLKDLKVKGSSAVVKGGTKVKNIRLVEGADGHDISCRIDGIGAMHLKSEFVKKS